MHHVSRRKDVRFSTLSNLILEDTRGAIFGLHSNAKHCAECCTHVVERGAQAPSCTELNHVGVSCPGHDDATDDSQQDDCVTRSDQWHSDTTMFHALLRVLPQRVRHPVNKGVLLSLCQQRTCLNVIQFGYGTEGAITL